MTTTIHAVALLQSGGIVYLIHRTNAKAGAVTYNFGDLARDRLIKGAAAYDSRGVPAITR